MKSRGLYYVVLFAFAMIFIAMYWVSPRIMDDCWVVSEVSDMSLTTLWTVAINNAKDYILYNSGRVANLVGLPFVLLPGWLAGVLFGGCAVLMIYLTARLSQVWTKDIVGFAVIIIVLGAIFPWYESMFVRMYVLNYIVSSLLMLWIVGRFFSGKQYNIVGTIVLGVILGAWHEAFSGVFLCAALAVMVLFKQYRTRTNIALMSSITAGLLFLVLQPGVGSRMDTGDAQVGGSILYCAPALLYILAYLIAFAFRRVRKELTTPFQVFVVVAVVTNIGVWYVFGKSFGPRVFIPAIVLMSASVARVASVLDWQRYRCATLCSVGLLWVVIGHFTSCVPWFYIYRQQVNLIAANDRGVTIFAPLITAENKPYYILDKPRMRDDEMLAEHSVVPSEFEDFEPEKARKVGEFVYEYNGYLIATQRGVGDMYVWFDGIPTYEESAVVRFENNAGTYWWYEPMLNIRKRRSHTITQVEFVRDE